MRGITHLTVGIATAAVLSGGAIIPMAAAGIGALLPDLDERHSLAGRRIWLFSALAQFIFGHRGWWHSLLGLIVAGAITYWLLPQAAWWVVLGFLTHLVLDGLTPEGIRPLWPLRWRLHGPVRTGSLGDIALGLAAIGVSAWILWPRV